MKIYAITVAFCPASQLARCLLELSKYKAGTLIDEHYVVQGHYPINTKKNNRDIALIVESYGKAKLLDPGSNLGSAQSQWWAVNQIGLEEGDMWINWDPDSNCPTKGWAIDMMRVMHAVPDCIVVSCMSPMVKKFIEERNAPLELKSIPMYDSYNPYYGIPTKPTPFNLSMWRYSFFKEIGGIPQMGDMWGEVEGAVWTHAKTQGKFHAYLLNHMEEESGKFLQDRQLLEFKDANMRTPGPDRFLGRFDEFLRWKYPSLAEMDTEIAENTVFQ